MERVMARRPLLFDDEYMGPRWRYGLPAHHLAYYVETSANDWIIYSERRSADPSLPFGTVDYPRELPEEDLQQLQLIPLGGMV
jgi:hypothetical protein